MPTSSRTWIAFIKFVKTYVIFLCFNIIIPFMESEQNSLEYIHICLELYFVKSLRTVIIIII